MIKYTVCLYSSIYVYYDSCLQVSELDARCSNRARRLGHHFVNYSFSTSRSDILSLVILLSIVLFFVGIEKIITGIFIAHKARFATIGLGILTIILAGLAMAYPVAAAIVVVFFLGFALLMDGFARIVDGITNKANKGWVRGFTIGVGILAVIISVMILASPVFGAVFAGLIIAMALLIIGIQMVAAGVSGRRESIVPSSSTSKFRE
jgi:uncharacterized membrane protein HdeD (DUF308 family)